jgi:hypothetical protein
MSLTQVTGCRPVAGPQALEKDTQVRRILLPAENEHEPVRKKTVGEHFEGRGPRAFGELFKNPPHDVCLEEHRLIPARKERERVAESSDVGEDVPFLLRLARKVHFGGQWHRLILRFN